MGSIGRVGTWTLGGAIALALVGFMTTRADEPKPNPKTRHWEGRLTPGSGAALRIVVHVTDGPEGTPTATLDSPDEGLEGLKLDPFTIDGSKIAFDLKLTHAHFEGTLDADGKEVSGTWTQRGAGLPLTLRQTDRPGAVSKIVGPETLWEGKLPLPGGVSLRLVLHVGHDAEGALIARLDSPDQGAKGLKVDSITFDKDVLDFELKRLKASYKGRLGKKGQESTGTFSQAGMTFPLTLKRVEKVAEPKRPQTPRPPFPYRVENVTYANKPGGVTLAGTLTLPSGKGPFPALVLISGSGAQDRDETIFEHRPFAVLADMLTRRGLAVLRVDDRGVGGSSGSTSKSTTEDFAGDVLAGIGFLKSRADIDPRRIGLLGHSEGGIIAPMVASKSDDVAFIVLLAGTGLPGDEIIRMQGRAISLAMAGQEKAATIDRQQEVQKRLLDVARSEPDDAQAVKKMRAVIDELKAGLNDDERKELAEVEGQLDGQFKMVRSPWFRFFLTYDPRPALSEVKCPVLAVIGEKDLQVPAKENLAEIGRALEKGGNTLSTVRQLPGLNHLFQTCKTGAPAEYAQIEETMAPSALEVIGDWVVEQVRVR